MTAIQALPGAWRGVVVLFLAVLMSAADQALPGLLMEPVKLSLGLTDTQSALLVGFSFGVSLSVFALPLSWIADRSDRGRLIAIAATVWCLMTVASGFAPSFGWLLALRMGVGLGEAALKPAAYSLMADLFPPEQLARPLALLAFAALLGSVLALNGGGALYEAVRLAAAAGRLPIAPGDAWRVVTVVFGAVGLTVAALAAVALPEPRRGRPKAVVDRRPGERGPTGLPDYLRRSAFFFVPFVGSMTAYVMFSAGFNGWLAPLFARAYSWPVGKIGQVLGTVGLVSTLLGLPLGVWLNRVLTRRLGREASVVVLWATMLFTTPLVVLTPLAPDGWWAAAGLTLILIPASAATVVAPIVFATTAPTHLRAQMIAVSGLVYGLVGSSTGGVLYARVTELAGGPSRLPVCMAVLSGLLMLVVVGGLLLADRGYGRVRRLVEAESAPL